MSNDIRLRSTKSVSNLVIGKPFINLLQEDDRKKKKNFEFNFKEEDLQNHEKIPIIVKHLEESFKDQSRKNQILESEKNDLKLKLDQTTKSLIKEREEYENLVFFRKKLELLPNFSWKGKIQDLKVGYQKKIKDLTDENSNLEKKYKQLEELLVRVRKKVETLNKEIEGRDKQIAALLAEKQSLIEKANLKLAESNRFIDILRQIYAKNPTRELNLDYLITDPSFFSTCVRMIELNPQLEKITIEGNNLTDSLLKEFTDMLKDFSGNLQTLDLSCNKLSVNSAWDLLNSLISRENTTSKSLKKLIFSHNLFEENELFIRAFSEIKPLTLNYATIKIKKKDFLLARGQQLNKFFHILCDKMYDNKFIKQITYLLDRTEVVQKTEAELVKQISKNKQEILEKFLSNEPVPEVKKSQVFKQKNDAKPDEEFDISSIMSQRFALNSVKSLLKSGFNVNTFDKNLEETLLMYACRVNNLPLCKLLVSKRAHLETRNLKGFNAFLIACFYDNLEIANYLVYTGANANSFDKKKANSIHHATIQGKPEKIAKLVELGTYVNWKDVKNKTPLHYSAKQTNVSVTEALIKLGAEINSIDSKGRSPLTIAESCGNGLVAKYLYMVGGKRIRENIEEGPKDGKKGSRVVKECFDKRKQLINDFLKTNLLEFKENKGLNKTTG